MSVLRSPSNLPLRARLLGAFGAILVVLIILTSAAYRTTTVSQDAHNDVVHTFRVISAANELLAMLVDMETGYRGFLITGDDLFLEPHLTAAAQIGSQLATLRTLTADSPDQLARWQAIETQVADWQRAVTDYGIVLRREVNAGRATLNDLSKYVSTGEGRRRFIAIRSVLEDALTEEDRLLAERQTGALEAGDRLKVVLAAGTVLAVLLSVALALLLTADIVTPVTRLATAAREIAGGNLHERINLHRSDEVGLAAGAFDQMADQLQATVLRSQTILDTAAEGILGLDHDGRVTFANAAAARMLGAPAAALTGQFAAPWFAVAPPDDERADANDAGATLGGDASQPAMPLSPIPAVLRGAPAAEGAATLVRTDNGQGTPVEYACTAMRRDRDIVGAVLTFRDVTERRAAQHALEDRARELARSNADLEQFAYVASHDLQEPLRAIVSYLQLLERRYTEQLDERGLRYIGHAVDGGRRMQTLITDLLTYSRVGRRGTEFAPVDLEAVYDRATFGLRVAIEESDALVTHDPLPTVNGDATQLTQVMQNLIGNAIKFRGEARPIIHVSAERETGGWLFSVRDNGIGIAPEYRERVFVLFQRLHARDEYSGTGIGLAVCKKIVERHGGTLWVDDTPGGGSTFRFTLPDAGDQA